MTKEPEQLKLGVEPTRANRSVQLSDKERLKPMLFSLRDRVEVVSGLYAGKRGEIVVTGQGWVLVRMDDPEIPPMTVGSKNAHYLKEIK